MVVVVVVLLGLRLGVRRVLHEIWQPERLDVPPVFFGQSVSQNPVPWYVVRPPRPLYCPSHPVPVLMALLPKEFVVVPRTLRLVFVPDSGVVPLLLRDVTSPLVVEAVRVDQGPEKRTPISSVTLVPVL